MSELKKLAIELYKPPFRHIHGYIYDADSCMVADDSALRVRGWGRIQYMDDAEALQDAAGELIAEALTEYWQRRTQPEATAPAQDQQLVVATSTETGFFHVVISLNDGKRMLVLYDKQHSLNGDTVGVADVPAAALASAANALSAGDRVDTVREFLRSLQRYENDCGDMMEHSKGDWVKYWDMHDVIHAPDMVAAIQAQKDGHGHD